MVSKAPEPTSAHERRWAPDRDDLLRQLWGGGLSCSQIAKEICRRLPGLTLTRNAVIGRAGRLALPGRGVPSSPRGTAPPKAKARSTVRSVPPASVFKAPPVPRDISTANGVNLRHRDRADDPGVVIPFTEDAPGLCTPLTIGPGLCKWPIGDPLLEGFTHCGRKAGGGPYCSDHAQRAFVPAKERTEAQSLGDQKRAATMRRNAAIRAAQG